MLSLLCFPSGSTKPSLEPRFRQLCIYGTMSFQPSKFPLCPTDTSWVKEAFLKRFESSSTKERELIERMCYVHGWPHSQLAPMIQDSLGNMNRSTPRGQLKSPAFILRQSFGPKPCRFKKTSLMSIPCALSSSLEALQLRSSTVRQVAGTLAPCTRRAPRSKKPRSETRSCTTFH